MIARLLRNELQIIDLARHRDDPEMALGRGMKGS